MNQTTVNPPDSVAEAWQGHTEAQQGQTVPISTCRMLASGHKIAVLNGLWVLGSLAPATVQGLIPPWALTCV